MTASQDWPTKGRSRGKNLVTGSHSLLTIGLLHGMLIHPHFTVTSKQVLTRSLSSIRNPPKRNMTDVCQAGLYQVAPTESQQEPAQKQNKSERLLRQQNLSVPGRVPKTCLIQQPVLSAQLQTCLLDISTGMANRCVKLNMAIRECSSFAPPQCPSISSLSWSITS